MHIAPHKFKFPAARPLLAASLAQALIMVAADYAAAIQPPIIPTLEALRAKVDMVWTNSVSASTLPPGSPFVHDLGVLAYGSTFPVSLFEGCGSVTNEGVVMHSLTVVESNDVTRVWACPGGEVARFPVPPEYNAGNWALHQFPPPAYLTPSERNARVAEAKLGGRQTLRMRLISESSIPSYLNSLASRASASATRPGTNEIGAVSARLVAGGTEIEVLVESPTDVGLIGIYKTGELRAPPDWTFQGFALRMASPMAFQLPVLPDRAYVLFANHLRDTDGDRIPDAYEELVTGTSAHSQDTDGDGLDDWSEVSLYKTSGTNPDTDGDALSDFLELEHGLDPLYNGASLQDQDGDGFADELEPSLGIDHRHFDAAPNLDIRMEFATREIKFRKFGFRAFSECNTPVNALPETFYLKSNFVESGFSWCPTGLTTNHVCVGSAEFDQSASKIVRDGCPTPPSTEQYPFFWHRGPNVGVNGMTCGTTNRTDVLLEGDLHYPGQYYRRPALCIHPEARDYFMFKQTLEKPFTDELLDIWSDAYLADVPWFGPGSVNRCEHVADGQPRLLNASFLEYASRIDMGIMDSWGQYAESTLIENPRSVASRWYTTGNEPNSVECMNKRDSRMVVTSTTPPGGSPPPALRSITYLELHAPEQTSGSSSSFLVGRRVILNPGVLYMNEPGRLRSDHREFAPPKKPGQILIIEDPIEVTAQTPSLVPDPDCHMRALSLQPSAFRISPHDLILPAGQLGWRSVPDVGLEIRQVRGPARSIVEDVNGVLPPLAGLPSDQFRYDLGPASDFAVTRTMFLSFPTNGLYVFHVALSGPNVGGERVMARWAVNVVDVSMGVDANRDGLIKFAGNWSNPTLAGVPMDETTQAAPYRFWVNNDADDTEREEGGSDSNPAPDWQDMTINGARDLEDFMRIHINLGELWDEIELGKVLVGFKWHSITGTPALNLFDHIDPEGGTRYLTDLSMGTVQAMSIAPIVQPTRSIASKDGTRRKIDDTAGAFILPNTYWEGVNSGKTLRHLLFEACGEGAGAFTLTFHSPIGTWLGDGPQVWLKFIDIKKLYIRSDGAKTIKDPPPDLTDETIVFVHGWNLNPSERTFFAETFYKRLWHRGFHGLYAAYIWDALYSNAEYWLPGPPGNALEAALAAYNNSEFNAWNSAADFKIYVESLPGVHKNIAAHSQGNIVAGEALRQGLSIENYALMQSAVPAACYDSDETRIRRTVQYPVYGTLVWDKDTPDADPAPETRVLAYRGRFETINQNAVLTSFILRKDYATFVPFEYNNDQFKPEGAIFAEPYHYRPANPAGQKIYKFHKHTIINPITQQQTTIEVFSHFLTNQTYEALSFASSTWGKALGAQNAAKGSIDHQIDLSDHRYDLFGESEPGFGDEHSGQFLACIQEVVNFYTDLIRALEVKVTP